MNEDDWKNAYYHYKQHQNEEYILSSSSIRTQCFENRSSIGIIRLQENEKFKLNQNTYGKYLDQFIDDLHNLFVKA